MAAGADAPRSARGGAFVAPLQPALLGEPLDFLAAEYARQTVLIAHLGRLTRDLQACTARDMAGLLLRSLAKELSLHLADGERSLFPRLRAHDTAGMLRRLMAEHGRDRQLVQDVAAGLRCLLDGKSPREGFIGAALAFAALHRRHLEVEEAEIAPLARRCLSAGALRELAAEMAARRAG